MCTGPPISNEAEYGASYTGDIAKVFELVARGLYVQVKRRGHATREGTPLAPADFSIELCLVMVINIRRPRHSVTSLSNASPKWHH